MIEQHRTFSSGGFRDQKAAPRFVTVKAGRMDLNVVHMLQFNAMFFCDTAAISG